MKGYLSHHRLLLRKKIMKPKVKKGTKGVRDLNVPDGTGKSGERWKWERLQGPAIVQPSPLKAIRGLGKGAGALGDERGGTEEKRGEERV